MKKSLPIYMFVYRRMSCRIRMYLRQNSFTISSKHAVLRETIRTTWLILWRWKRRIWRRDSNATSVDDQFSSQPLLGDGIYCIRSVVLNCFFFQTFIFLWRAASEEYSVGDAWDSYTVVLRTTGYSSNFAIVLSWTSRTDLPSMFHVDKSWATKAVVTHECLL
jgi:hypothetical protein